MQETDFPFEVILGDDDSSDGTKEVCMDYASKHPDKIRFFMHKRENCIDILGRPSGIFQIAYNLYHCRGRYLALCSGDDFWQDKFKLQKQVDVMNKATKVSFCYHDHSRLFCDTGGVEGPFSADRIQTVLGRNLFGKLPESFVHAIQEDGFLKFFWRAAGPSLYLDNIKPAMIRFHSESMYTSLDGENLFRQRKNLLIRIQEACLSDPALLRKARFELVRVIIYHFSNDENMALHQKVARIYSELRTLGVRHYLLPFMALTVSKRLGLRLAE